MKLCLENIYQIKQEIRHLLFKLAMYDITNSTKKYREKTLNMKKDHRFPASLSGTATVPAGDRPSALRLI